VIDYLRTRINQHSSSSINDVNMPITESIISFDSSSQNAFSPTHQQNLPTMIDNCDPLWLEFLQSFNTVENKDSNIQQNTTQSTVIFDSLFSEDDDDEEFIGPEDENIMESTDERKLRVSSMII
jgi:hypothetical protein